MELTVDGRVRLTKNNVVEYLGRWSDGDTLQGVQFGLGGGFYPRHILRVLESLEKDKKVVRLGDVWKLVL